MTVVDCTRRKLQAVKMSGRMAALLGCVFGETWTNPRIAELCQTSDGMLLARHEGDCGFNDFIGAVNEWRQNVLGIAKVAGLTPKQTQWLRTKAGV